MINKYKKNFQFCYYLCTSCATNQIFKLIMLFLMKLLIIEIFAYHYFVTFLEYSPISNFELKNCLKSISCDTSAMDKFQLTGRALGRVFNFRSGCMHIIHLLPSVAAIQPNLELKTRPKQLLGSLPLVIALPGSLYFKSPCTLKLLVR